MPPAGPVSNPRGSVIGRVSAILAVVLIWVLTDYLDPMQYGQVALGLASTGAVGSATGSAVSIRSLANAGGSV